MESEETMLNRLLKATRKEAPSDRVPYAFEQRIRARIAEEPVAGTLLAWSQGLWRWSAVAPCLVLMLLAMIWQTGQTENEVAPPTNTAATPIDDATLDEVEDLMQIALETPEDN